MSDPGCRRCRRRLRDPESVRRGIGPKCEELERPNRLMLARTPAEYQAIMAEPKNRPRGRRPRRRPWSGPDLLDLLAEVEARG